MLSLITSCTAASTISSSLSHLILLLMLMYVSMCACVLGCSFVYECVCVSALCTGDVYDCKSVCVFEHVRAYVYATLRMYACAYVRVLAHVLCHNSHLISCHPEAGTTKISRGQSSSREGSCSPIRGESQMPSCARPKDQCRWWSRRFAMD